MTIEVFCSIGSFLEVIKEDDCLRDKLGIKRVLCVLGNKELKVLKVAECPRYQICSISNVWPVQCEVDQYVV
jgi:hypothetical protein